MKLAHRKRVRERAKEKSICERCAYVSSIVDCRGRNDSRFDPLSPSSPLAFHTATAGLGIGLTKDKLGNHVVKKLAKGWPAEQSGLIEEKVHPRNCTPLWQWDHGIVHPCSCLHALRSPTHS